MRSHYCGEVNRSAVGREVTVAGWVHRRRDHGGVIFIDLRDREGLLQVVFDPDRAEMFAEAERLRSEYVLQVEGRVRERPAGTVNPSLASGEVELLVEFIRPILPLRVNSSYGFIFIFNCIIVKSRQSAQCFSSILILVNTL